MEQTVVVQEGKPLSQVERVVDTFIAPAKTFTDIRRSTSWWLPFVLICLALFFSAYAVDHTIGFEQVAEHEMTRSPAAAERMQQLTPAERAQRVQIGTTWTRNLTYAGPVLVLFFVAVEALVLWGSFNFGLGAQTTFPQMFAVVMYAGLPRIFVQILNGILLFAGVGTDNYDPRNPVGTNLGYFLGDAPAWLRTAGSFFDVFSIWSLILLILGTAIIARRTKGQAAMIILGWWVLCLIVFSGLAAVGG